MTAAERDKLLIDTHTMTRELRVVVLGTNGHGLLGAIEEMKGDEKTIVGRLDKMEKNMVTASVCSATRDGDLKRKRSRWLVVKDIALLMLGGGGAIGAVLSVLSTLH